MKVTYLCHSGFAVETESAMLVFDYIKGDLPERGKGKKLVFFVSHYHDDHYSENIFSYSDADVCYVLDSGIVHYPENVKINLVSERKCYSFGNMTVKTLRSTDCGVAYLVKIDGHTIYHAGDLHLWVWKGAHPFQRNAVKYAFESELSSLENEKIDVAFLPLDPRQEDEGSLGFDYAMKTLDIKFAVPMHFWEDANYVKSFVASEKAASYRERMCVLLAEGESAELFE